MEKYVGIKNGECRSNTGTKQAVFTPELVLRPVLYAVYSGYRPERGTVQGSLPGDLITKITWSRSGEEFEITRDGERLPAGQEAGLWVKLKELHPWLDAFLEPEGRGSCFLPLYVAPEEDYICVRAKRARISKAIQRFGLPYEVKDFMADPKKGLSWAPRPLDFDPETYLPSERFWDGSVVGISRYERWYGSSGDGTSVVPLDIDPEYVSGSNYAHTETVSREGSAGIIGWQAYPIIIRVVHGAYTRNHFSYGHTVDVWSTGKEVA